MFDIVIYKLISILLAIRTLLNLISDSDPIISQIISSPENFEVITIRYKVFNHLINLFWFLTLASSSAKYHVTHHILIIFRFSLNTYKTCFFCMLEIITMPFRYFPIHSLFDPHYFIAISKYYIDIYL